MSEAENKKEYEMSYFLTSDITEDNIDSAVNELNLLITENGGGNIALEIPKRKRLSYPIKKQSEGYFGVAYFNIGAEGLDKIKKALSFHKKILRFLIIANTKNPKSTPKKSETFQNEKTKPSEPAMFEDGKLKEMPPQSFDQKLENILNG